MSEPRPLVRVGTVAARLGVRPWRVYELVRRGLLPAVRFGRDVRFDPDQLERWIQAGGALTAPGIDNANVATEDRGAGPGAAA